MEIATMVLIYIGIPLMFYIFYMTYKIISLLNIGDE